MANTALIKPMLASTAKPELGTAQLQLVLFYIPLARGGSDTMVNKLFTHSTGKVFVCQSGRYTS